MPEEKLQEYIDSYKKDREVRFIEPMASQEYKDKKLEDIPFDLTNTIAELKHDGHRGILYVGEKMNRNFSRVVSKKTKWFTENTDNVPHITQLKMPDYRGTVLDGEFDYGTDSMHVQSVMGSLPERAIKYQKENGNIDYIAFDILFYRGVDVRRMPLYKRKALLADVIYAFHRKYGSKSKHIKYADIYYVDDEAKKKIENYAMKNYLMNAIYHVRRNFKGPESGGFPDFKAMMGRFLYEGLEGIMTKDLEGIYESKRSKAYIKHKGESTWDCIVMGLKPSTKEYKGKEIYSWKYWEIDGKLKYVEGGFDEVDKWTFHQGVDAIPVTKPYFNGWCGAIEFGVAIGKPFCVGRDDKRGVNKVIENGEKDGKKYVLIHEDEGGFWLIEVMHVGDCKGLTEEVQEDIKNNYYESYNGKVIEVRANGIINKETGTLRHPVFERIRDDKSPEQCDFESHIRVELE